MIDRNHLDEAVAHCQHILKTFPKHLETYRLLGKAYLEAKRHNEAVDIFTRVLAAEPNDFVAHVGMSIIRDEQNKLDDAIWHMERAYEVHSANPAIMGELQRLYGRRDGVQPPRIRMTRGALAHMYMRGELYPQAISETKSVLEEDQGRSDMQVLLAKAYYRSGQKKDAADAASAVLKRYPFCLDANLVLAEILNTDRPESAQTYRRRVIELDPYAAQAVDNMFLAGAVSDAAISIDHLEWNGQPVGMTADWSTSRAIDLESGTREEQPDWLKTSEPPLSAPAFASEQETSTSPAQPADDIPDFLRAAGWGAATGAFDESKASAMFEDATVPPAEPIAQGDLPEWVKAMAPQEAVQPAEEEQMPDWINKIGSDALPVTSDVSGDQMDWLGGLSEPSKAGPSEEQPDWMKSLEQEEQPAPVSDEQPDWLKGLGGEEQAVSASMDQPDWLSGMMTEPVSSQPPSEMDFLDELKQGEPAPSSVPASKIDTGSLGASEAEQDDSFAWLENLAAKQGATEGLLTKPEERLEEEPDWIKQAKSLSQPEMELPLQEAPAIAAPVDTGSLGTSDKDRDDSFAWLEALAAKQGATEGLLTSPEERMEQEPEWVKQVRKATGELKPEPVQQTPAEEPPVEIPPPVSVLQPKTEVENTVGSEKDIDDALAWFESLAARQGATEGLLTKPEERLAEEPEWVRQAKGAGAQQPPVQPPPIGAESLPETEPVEPDTQAKSFAPVDDVSSWLKGLDEGDAKEEPAPVAEDDTTAWLKSLDEPEGEPIHVAPASEDLPAWMQDVGEAEAPVAEPVVPMDEAKPVRETGEVPSWLSGLEAEERIAPTIPAADDLPAWMRDETGEVVAEPTRIEPTRATDWAPVDEMREEPAEPEVESKPAPSLAPVQDKAKKPKKEKVKPAVPPQPYQEPVTIKGTGMLGMPVDPILGSARAELSRSNIPGALDAYGKLIKKGRFLEETIFDLREALYRYPVEVSIWQSLGDAYMRSNQLQDALDAYTKAEELLR
jgi:tetratricopeptide (TPR) repeat protein